MGGRKKGVPNKFPREAKEVVLATAEHLGFDGHGFGGLYGYVTWLAVKHPEVYARLLSRILSINLRQKATDSEQKTFDVSKLNDDELLAFVKIVEKAYVPPDEDVSLPPIDADLLYEKIAELKAQAKKI